jgi:endo-1,3(4)-beta-glucanase
LYTLVHDYMSMTPHEFPRLRSFDCYSLHSWASGLTEFADGRNQESTSEAVNAYYAAALLGLAYEDFGLVNIASTLCAFECRSSQLLWHLPTMSRLYEPEFTKANRVVSVLWSTKRDSGLWFAGQSPDSQHHYLFVTYSWWIRLSGRMNLLEFHKHTQQQDVTDA